MRGNYDRMLSAVDSNGWLKPDYRNMCLSNLAAYVSAILTRKDGKLPEELNGQKGKNNVILVIADGMGLLNIGDRLKELPFLRNLTGEGKVLPMTSVFPSTTAASLASIFTGLEPVTHGLLEWNLFLDEAGMIIETLPFKAQNPAEQEQFLRLNLQVNTLFEGEPASARLQREGIDCTTYLPENIADSPFSVAVQDKAVRRGYDRLDDTISELVHRDGERTFKTVYYPEVDAAGHVYGPSSSEYLEEMRTVDSFLSELAAASDDDTVVLLTADHGQIEIEPADTLYLDELEWFDGMLALHSGGKKIAPYGSPRDVIIRAIDGNMTCSILNEKLSEFGVAKTTGWMTGEGYFGNGRKAREFEARAGSAWFIPHAGKTVWYRHYDNERVAFRGVHGGPTPGEMMVPLAVI